MSARAREAADRQCGSSVEHRSPLAARRVPTARAAQRKASEGAWGGSRWLEMVQDDGVCVYVPRAKLRVLRHARRCLARPGVSGEGWMLIDLGGLG